MIPHKLKVQKETVSTLVIITVGFGILPTIY